MNRILQTFSRAPWALLVLAAVGLGPAWAANVVQDNFTGGSASQDWDVFGGACLTAGTNTGTIPACKTGTDPANQGALRLTQAANNQAGAIISNWTFPSNQGLQVTFTTYTFGGDSGGGAQTGADGIGFYLLDGSVPPNIGAFGGSLGYTCSHSNSPHDGMIGGYLGLGMDEYGNFLNPGDNTATGNGYHPNEIGVRGYGSVNWTWLNANFAADYPSWLSARQQQDAVDNTCHTGHVWDYSSPNNPKQTSQTVPDYAQLSANYLPSGVSLSDESATTRNKATPITYRLIITSGGLMSLDYKRGTASTFTSLISQQDISLDNGPMPKSFRFGFGASTGGSTNYHEITCFEATPAARTIAAPLAPTVISSGQYVYTLSTNPSPVQGYADAYALTATGGVATSPTWDAGTLMKATRTAKILESTAANGSSVVSLDALDSGAFALAKNSCVPDVATIIAYTVDPSSVTAPGSCQPYLGVRAPGSLLGGFSAGDAAALLQPPGNPADIAQPGYVGFAQAESTRPAQLLFTNDDGFLYGIDASSGALRWAWMPRQFVSLLQDYGTFPGMQNFSGNFSAVDASTSSSGSTRNWATYLVGSAQGGALWWDLKLDAQGRPASVVKTLQAQVGTGQPPANTSWLPAGAYYPQRQAPVSTTVGNNQYAAFVVNDASGASYLVEFDVATGAPTGRAPLYAQITAPKGSRNTALLVSSNLYFDSASGELYFGTTSGEVYVTSFSGDAAVDAANATYVGTVQDSGNPVQFVGSQTVGRLPYVWATTTAAPSASKAAGITVFGIGNNGFAPIWASSPAGAYTYGGSSWTTATSGVQSLQRGALISDAPRVVNGTLVVPVYVPPAASASACNVNGTGYYDFFSLASGVFPRNAITYGTQTLKVKGNLPLGQGSAYMPNLAVSGSSVAVFGGTQQSSSPLSPLLFPISALNAVTQWRVH